MIEELKQKLGQEVEHLQHELNVTLPNEIRKAVELGDLREGIPTMPVLRLRDRFFPSRSGSLPPAPAHAPVRVVVQHSVAAPTELAAAPTPVGTK